MINAVIAGQRRGLKMDELTQLIMFCEGMRVNMDESQSKTLNDLINAAMTQALGYVLEIKNIRKMLADVEEHGILSVLERFEGDLAKSVERVAKVQETLTGFEDRFAEMNEKMENNLAYVHSLGSSEASAIAVLCDERLDKSGALLGRVRNISAAMAIVEREEAEGIK